MTVYTGATASVITVNNTCLPGTAAAVDLNL
jgi:hypothetical protein